MSETENFQAAAPASSGVPPMPPKVANAIAQVMTAVPKLARGERNSHGNYQFASVDDFLEALRPICGEHGLLIIQDEEQFSLREGESTDRNGRPTKTLWLLLSFRFTLAHSSGETWAHRPTRSIMVNASMGSQAFGAAQSYTLKQFMRSLFQVATGEKGQDADEHPPADLPQRNSRKSSAALKRENVWPKLEHELSECESVVAVDRLQRDYQANEYATWNQTFRDQADELFDKRRMDFGKEPGEALTLREQLTGSLAPEDSVLKAEPQSRAEYVQWCHDHIESLQTEGAVNAWWDNAAPANRRFRLSPAEETDLKARAKARIKAIRGGASQTTFVPNGKEKPYVDKAGNELHPLDAG